MKQAEHPPATAGASIAAEYSLALIDQLAHIDRTCSKEEMDELVYRLLSLIGEAMQSDRVFLFERLEGTAEAYCDTFEWCANGVAPQIDNLTEIVPTDMSYWLEVFGRGETIVIPNIEDVKTLMPSKYELLKAQSIRSEIAVPVFYRGSLSGFFGLDNPQRTLTDNKLRLLAFVGGHLGSARENLRMLTLLEEKQKSLEQNLQAVKLEQQILKVLCKDSTSVYRVDLMNDRAEIVKIEEHSNSAGDLLPHGQELFSYAEAVEHYYHKCVLKESALDFLQFLDAENLRTKDRVSRRYQSVPNAIGNIYFEVRANRVQQTETSFQILLDFRSVDEIVREEREHQHALETALTESRMSYEVISAISKIYYMIYRIDLRTGYYEEVASERQMHRLTGHSGRASVHMSEMSKQSIVAGVSALC
ncbi:MAG: GAF domain-containing protein [Oscillospiraceae bacterium]|nr:GAF domain-containing protein [Oscillospiraceae bacterium]